MPANMPKVNIPDQPPPMRMPPVHMPSGPAGGGGAQVAMPPSFPPSGPANAAPQAATDVAKRKLVTPHQVMPPPQPEYDVIGETGDPSMPGQWITHRQTGENFFVPGYGPMAGVPIPLPSGEMHVNDPEVMQFAAGQGQSPPNEAGAAPAQNARRVAPPTQSVDLSAVDTDALQAELMRRLAAAAKGSI